VNQNRFRLSKAAVATLALAVASCGRPAAAPEGYPGTWVMKLGQRVFIVLTITDNNGKLAGRLSAPASFGLPEGATVRINNIKLPIVERDTSRAAIEGDHLHLVVADPAHPSEPDEYDFALKGRDEAVLTFTGIPITPFPFVRHRGREPVVPATDWTEGRSYTLHDEPTTPNKEMASIYDEDQRVRQEPEKLSAADWEKIEKGDAARRAATKSLLDTGQLHIGEDFRKAAFVFQHGSGPPDFLLAHTLAMIAMSKGDGSALWIASATLDRYLQSIRQPQIYGTQFLTPSGKPVTQDPYDRTLISDALRAELGVPELKFQAERVKEFEAARKASAR
jgi:hypothetical protein